MEIMVFASISPLCLFWWPSRKYFVGFLISAIKLSDAIDFLYYLFMIAQCSCGTQLQLWFVLRSISGFLFLPGPWCPFSCFLFSCWRWVKYLYSSVLHSPVLSMRTWRLRSCLMIHKWIFEVVKHISTIPHIYQCGSWVWWGISWWYNCYICSLSGWSEFALL